MSQVLVVINHKGMGFDDLLLASQNEVASGGDRLQKQAIGNIARYIPPGNEGCRSPSVRVSTQVRERYMDGSMKRCDG